MLSMAKPSQTDLRYLEMGEQELLSSIGRILLADTLSQRPADERDIRLAARRWFDQQLGGLRKIICENPDFRAQLGPGQNDRNTLFGIVFDILSGPLLGRSLDIPVGALTAQVLVYGIPKLCSDVAGCDDGRRDH